MSPNRRSFVAVGLTPAPGWDGANWPPPSSAESLGRFSMMIDDGSAGRTADGAAAAPGAPGRQARARAEAAVTVTAVRRARRERGSNNGGTPIQARTGTGQAHPGGAT